MQSSTLAGLLATQFLGSSHAVPAACSVVVMAIMGLSIASFWGSGSRIRDIPLLLSSETCSATDYWEQNEFFDKQNEFQTRKKSLREWKNQQRWYGWAWGSCTAVGHIKKQLRLCWPDARRSLRVLGMQWSPLYRFRKCLNEKQAGASSLSLVIA